MTDDEQEALSSRYVCPHVGVVDGRFVVYSKGFGPESLIFFDKDHIEALQDHITKYMIEHTAKPREFKPASTKPTSRSLLESLG